MITTIVIALLAALAVFLRFWTIARRARRRAPLQYRDGRVVVEGFSVGKAARLPTDAELQAMIDRTVGQMPKRGLEQLDADREPPRRAR